MLKMWMEEYLPGHFIKYDGFRDTYQYSVIIPGGRSADVNTLKEAIEVLTENNGLNGSEISCKIHFPLHGPGSKWYIAKYKDISVCVMVEFTDGNFLVDLGCDSDGNNCGMEIVHKNDLMSPISIIMEPNSVKS